MNEAMKRSRTDEDVVMAVEEEEVKVSDDVSSPPHANSAVDDSQQFINRIDQEIITVQQSIDKVQVTITNTENEIEKTEAAVETASRNFIDNEPPGKDHWEKEKDRLTQKAADLRKKEADLRKEKADLRKEKADLRKEKDDLRNGSRSGAGDALQRKRGEMRQHGRLFVDSIMKPLANIDSTGMQVMRCVHDLEVKADVDLVIRSLTIPFWEDCIKLVDTSDHSYRVCVVGTPGVGKSSMIPLLIRMLLQKGKRIVFICRSVRENSWFYEFTPGEKQTEVEVYPEKVDLLEIASLREDRDTYYIVDPGKNKESCDTSTDFLPKTIIVASPDPCHWGNSEFEKLRGGSIGFFKYFPLWTLQELLDARPVLGAHMSDEKVCERFRWFGGVPRHVYVNDSNAEGVKIVKKALDHQNRAISCMTSRQAYQIATNEMDGVGTLENNHPKSAVIGLECKPNCDFDDYDIVVISSLVAEKVYSRFISEIWTAMMNSKKNGCAIFEAYTRRLMTQEVTTFYGRRCVGMSDPERNKQLEFEFGGCTEIRLSSDIAKAAQGEKVEKVVFHSVDHELTLFDFIYRVEDVFHVFQVTIGKTHDCDVTHVQQLYDRLREMKGPATMLKLHYLVPDERYTDFVTDPVCPGEAFADRAIETYHVMVPNPKKKFPSRSH